MNDGLEAPGGRMEVDGTGSGESSAVAIGRRAAELAHTEGRDHVSEGDRIRARRELNGPVKLPPPPELIGPEIEGLIAWDEPPAAAGRRAQPAREDEGTIAEQLVQEGVEEADHQRRVFAVHEQDKAAGRD